MRTIQLKLVLLLLFLGAGLGAQNSFSVNGIVADSSGAPLPGATVVMMQRADSVLTAFGISEKDGSFSIPKTAKGDYILQITYVGYQTYSRDISLTQDIHLGQIRLEVQSTALQEVVVKGEHIPIAIRNDTIEYNAAAFQVEPNAPVEALLRKLPGVEVDRQGNIKAQGEDVNKVLVDGKEFFGDDPKIATKNLPADAVDKVQVFDKKSEMAEFSGIDDGNEQKTINLALKEDKKQGYFGNVSAGYGTDERYQGKANINRFSKKSQVSALGMLNNINEQGFSFEDYLNFMGGLQNMMAGGGSFRISINSDESGIPLNFGDRNGLATTAAGGLNLNYELGDRAEFHASYFYNRVARDQQRSIHRENLLEEEIFTTEEESDQFSRNANHRLNTTFRFEADSTQRLIIRGGLGLNDAFLDNYLLSQTRSVTGMLANNGLSNYHSDGTGLNWDAGATYLKRFRRPGRVLSANLNSGMQVNDQTGLLYSENTFLPSNQPAYTDTTNQKQINRGDQLSFGGRISYTEPLGKGKYLEVNYSHQDYGNDSEKEFYEISPSEEIFNPRLSTHYLRDYLYDRAGLNFRYNREKFNLTLGTALQHSRLEGVLADENIPVKKTFTNHLPTLRANWDFTISRHLNFEYQTEVREPSLQQLSPVIDNSDPLNTYSGNPNLRAEYAHLLDLRFFSFDQFSNISVFANLRGRYSSNRITNSQEIDSLFRQHITPVNVKDDWEGSGFFSYGMPLRFIKSRITFEANGQYNRSLVFVNGLSNRVNRWNGTLGLSLEYNKKKWIDAVAGVDWGFNTTRFSEDGSLDRDFFQQNFYADLTLKPGKTWSFEQSVDYTSFSGSAFSDTEVGPLWTASISKFLWKNKLQLKLSAFDILGKNNGLSRSSDYNYLQEERVNTLGRYVMLSATWSLSGFGAEEGGIQITTRRR